MAGVANLRHTGAGALVALLLVTSAASATQPSAAPPAGTGAGGVVGVPADLSVADPAPAPEVPDLATDSGMRASPTSGRDLRLRDAEELDIPAAALAAYRFAAETLSEADPACRLDWSLLAAIGKVESDHGRYAGAELGVDGVSDPPIRGVALDGSGPVARVTDTDGGRIDGDARWDRAVGPMQFLPSTWVYAGVDADGDDVRSADDLDDAALGAAVYLCAGDGDLGTRADLRTAIHTYNHSEVYVDTVMRLAAAYADGDFEELWPSVPGFVAQAVRDPAGLGPTPARPTTSHDGSSEPGSSQGKAEEKGGASDQKGKRPTKHSEALPAIEEVPTLAPPAQSPSQSPAQPPTQPPTQPTGQSPAPSPTTTEEPGPSEDPQPTDDPTPTETPTPEEPSPGDQSEPPAPDPTTLVGALTVVDDVWLLGETVLDVGDAELLATAALADLDGDGAVETNLEELTGLAAAADPELSVVVLPGEESAVLLTVGELSYREE